VQATARTILASKSSGSDSSSSSSSSSTSGSTAAAAAAAATQQQQQQQQQHSSVSSSSSANSSSDAPQQADVAADVSELRFQVDIGNFISGQVMPRLEAAAALEDVRRVLVELQGFVELADEHDCAIDYRCADVLKRSLQDAYNSNTEQLSDGGVIFQWLQQHRKRCGEARQLLRPVRRNCLLTTTSQCT
jgi:hypothetical protein